MMTRDQVLEKIRKMLALAAGTANNENEAANAAAMAQRLMLRHKIEQAEVSMDSAAEKIEVITDDAATWGVPFHWDTGLLGGVARANACDAILKTVFKEGRTVKVGVLIGERAAVQTVNYLYQYLRREVVEISAVECKGKGFEYSNTFKIGMVRTITDRLIKELQLAAAGESGETALAIINKERAAVEDFKAQQFKKLIKRTGPKVRDAAAYFRGVQKGNDVALPGKEKQLGKAAEKLGAAS